MLFGCSLTVERLWLSCRPYHCWISEWVIWLHLFLVGTARLHEYLINHTLSTLRRRIAWFKSNQVDEGWEVNEWIRNDNQKPSWSDSVWCWSEALGSTVDVWCDCPKSQMVFGYPIEVYVVGHDKTQTGCGALGS